VAGRWESGFLLLEFWGKIPAAGIAFKIRRVHLGSKYIILKDLVLCGEQQDRSLFVLYAFLLFTLVG